MKIQYLNGSRLYHAFLAGGEAVIRDQAYLNKINVFPVPDADTGTNLATTMRAIAEGSEAHQSIKRTLKSIANAALSGARGNSGLIFAQFIHGMSREIGQDEPKLTTRTFGESVRRAVQHTYRAIVHPVEGTMITVIRDWAEAVYQRRTQTADFVELLSDSLQPAMISLRETTHKLQVLAKAGVVDAGAKGFVDFLEGILHFIAKGKLTRIAKADGDWALEEIKTPAEDRSLEYRYCTEALLSGENLDADAVRAIVQGYGNSAVVGGSEERVRIHVHTNNPSGLFFEVKNLGAIAQIHVDDIRKQYEAAHARKAEIAIVTDSACDLPQDILDENQIHVIPFSMHFGTMQFLDKVTITPAQFYNLLRTNKDHPTTAQPAFHTVHRFLAFLAGHYRSLIVIAISDKLTGFYNLCLKAAEQIPGKKISVLNSRTLSAALGLLVERASRMALSGASHQEIVKAVESWIPKTKTFVDVKTLKYLIRGGRVGRTKGWIGRILHLKPILVLDEEGKAADCGKVFTRRGSMSRILEHVKNIAAREKIRGYAVVHVLNPERAEIYARKLTKILGMAPEFIQDVAPVIGAHAGIGAAAVALVSEEMPAS